MTTPAVTAESRRAPRGHIAIILNPASGRGQGRRRRPELERLLGENSAESDWRIIETTRPGGGSDAARQAVEDGASVIGAAGGDGTYGEVVNGIFGSGAALGILPLGTGNDFSRALGIQTDLGAAVRTLFHGKARSIDLGRCGERYFINVAGCGFDAVVAERVNRGFRYLRGTGAYIAAVVSSLARYNAARMEIVVDGRLLQLNAMLCSIANSPSYGGGMRIAPNASIDDGLLDICILGKAGKVEFLRAFPRVFKGTHVSHPKVTMLTGRRIQVTSDPTLPVLIDGDVLQRTPADFRVIPGAIQVMTP